MNQCMHKTDLENKTNRFRVITIAIVKLEDRNFYGSNREKYDIALKKETI